MKATIANWFSVITDSPTLRQDRSNLFSGFTVGTAGLLLNGAVLFLIAPLMLDYEDRFMLEITESLEFGQLIGLILLAGITGIATALVPLRLFAVFWGPRISRYFDQVVLSGISPIRFAAGKVISQNYFLGLCLCILLPYFVLSLALGGVDLAFVASALALIWLYCMMLALVTLWISLYANELMAAVKVVAGFGILSALGFVPAPLPAPLFPVTPFPVLSHKFYSSIDAFNGMFPVASYWTTYAWCAGGMLAICTLASFAIYLGPLYGIVRDNSTFGEVVRPGDARKKRWFRLRHHIQRPSELAFFYQNRPPLPFGSEGLVRWGLGLGVLTTLSLSAYILFVGFLAWIIGVGGAPGNNLAYGFHISTLVIHGASLLLAVILFSHTRNTTFQRVSFLGSLRARVSKLDTACFVLVLGLNTTVAMGLPFVVQRYVLGPLGIDLFPAEIPAWQATLRIDFVRVAIEGTLLLTLAGLVVYGIMRCVSLATWLKPAAVMATVGLYLGLVCIVPILVGMLCVEVPELREIPTFNEYGPRFSMVSPMASMSALFGERLNSSFPENLPRRPFFIAHGVLLAVLSLWYWRSSRNVRRTYLPDPWEATA